jgi:hypothetical protein
VIPAGGRLGAFGESKVVSRDGATTQRRAKTPEEEYGQESKPRFSGLGFTLSCRAQEILARLVSNEGMVTV